MCFSKEIDLRILIAEHFGNARTGREINLLGFSWVKFLKSQKNGQKKKRTNKNFLSQNVSPYENQKHLISSQSSANIYLSEIQPMIFNCNCCHYFTLLSLSRLHTPVKRQCGVQKSRELVNPAMDGRVSRPRRRRRSERSRSRKNCWTAHFLSPTP